MLLAYRQKNRSTVSEANDQPAPLTVQEKIAVFLLPNIGDILFVLLLWFPLWLSPSFVFGDGSTGWHLVAGNYILDTHSIPHQDLFSYTMKDAPWVAYEWLSDALMALSVRAGGLNLLAVFVACAVGLLIIMLYQRCRKEGAHFLPAMFLCLISVMLIAVHWLARPHLFTFFGVYIFSTVLHDFYLGRIGKWRLLTTLALCMLVWVNTHPAFLLGFVLIAIYLFCSLAGAVVWARSSEWKDYLERAKWLALSVVACGVATLINPYGTKLYEYVQHYLHGNKVLNATDEFLSPVFHGGLQPACLEILFACLLLGLAVSKRRITMPRLLTCLAFGHLTLTAVRNMPLFAIIALPVISHLFGQISFGLNEDKLNWKWLREQWVTRTATFDENELLCNKHVWPIVVFVLLVAAACNGGSLFGNKMLACGWGEKTKPTVTLECLRQAEKNGTLAPDRGFNYDNWGGYLRYMLGTRVFIDDRADFYGEDFYTRYSIINMVQPGWQKLLDQQHIQWVLTPKHTRLELALNEASDWRKASEDPASVLFVRK